MAGEQDTGTDQGAGGDGGQGAGGSGAARANQSGGSGRTFTREQLDAIIADRLGRERDRYKDYDSLKTAKAELEKLKQGQMSESQRLQAHLDMLAKENDSLKAATQLHQAQGYRGTYPVKGTEKSVEDAPPRL